MTIRPLPSVPWQVTGNHWLALPCIHPNDGAIHALCVLHRGSRSAIEFAGGAGFVDGNAPALARPALFVNGERRELADAGIAWERAMDWLPTFTCTVGDLVVRATIFAPHGRDADMAGAAYVFAVENRGKTDADVAVALEGVLGHRQLRVRTPRSFDDAHRVSREGEVIVLEGAALPGLVAFAVGADDTARTDIASGKPNEFSITRSLKVAPGERAETAFFIAAGPERDGALATVEVMRRRGWREMLRATRDALQDMEQTTGFDPLDRLVNRNLLFAYFYGVGRALDDAHFYLVRSRAPWNGRGITVRDWEALTWTIPAVQLADAALARELLLRMCEIHGYAPGRGVNYMDGTQFEPGFNLEGAAAYAVATDRYIRDTNDDQLVEEPVLADTLYLAADDIAQRRNEQVPLYTTEVTLSGVTAAQPYTLHANAVVAQALEIFRRTLDEATARDVEDPEAVRAALKRHFSATHDGKSIYASATNLEGEISVDDDPLASVLWLPMYETLDRQDSAFRRTARAAEKVRVDGAIALAQQCARLVGPDAQQVLQWLRRATLENGLAAEFLDEKGAATGNGGDAALSGLLAYTLWYAVHALGLSL